MNFNTFTDDNCLSRFWKQHTAFHSWTLLLRSTSQYTPQWLNYYILTYAHYIGLGPLSELA